MFNVMLCVYLIIRLFYLMCDVIDRHDMYTHVISSVLRTERIFRSNDSDSARVLVIGQRRGWRPGRGLSSANPTYFPNRGNGAEIYFLRVSYQYSLGGGGREAARSGEQGVSHVGPEKVRRARVLVFGQRRGWRRGWRPGRGLSSANPAYFPNRNGAEIYFLRLSYQ